MRSTHEHNVSYAGQPCHCFCARHTILQPHRRDNLSALFSCFSCTLTGTPPSTSYIVVTKTYKTTHLVSNFRTHRNCQHIASVSQPRDFLPCSAPLWRFSSSYPVAAWSHCLFLTARTIEAPARLQQCPARCMRVWTARILALLRNVKS